MLTAAHSRINKRLTNIFSSFCNKGCLRFGDARWGGSLRGFFMRLAYHPRAAALGVPTVKGGAVNAKLCDWFVPTKNDPQGLEKNIEIAILSSRAYGAVSLMTSTATKQVEPVSGIGDGAVQVTSKMGTVLDVKKGDNYFSVSVMRLPLDQAKAAAQSLAKQILPKL